MILDSWDIIQNLSREDQNLVRNLKSRKDNGESYYVRSLLILVSSGSFRILLMERILESRNNVENKIREFHSILLLQFNIK